MYTFGQFRPPTERKKTMNIIDTVTDLIADENTAVLADIMDDLSLNDDMELFNEVVELLEIADLINEVSMEEV